MRVAGITTMVLSAVFFASGAAAALQVKQVKSVNGCGQNFEPLVSYEDPSSTSNNPGFPNSEDLDPGYDHRLCVSGVRSPYSPASGTCNGGKRPEFYLNEPVNETTIHLSNSSIYTNPICAGTLKTRFRQESGVGSTCKEDEKRLFTASNLQNGHVAGPSQTFFEFVVCGSIEDPQTVELSYSFDLPGSEDSYLGNRPLTTDSKVANPSFPAIVSTDQSYVTGLVAEDAVNASKDSNRTLKLSREADSADFILPLTSGSEQVIQDEERDIRNSNFLTTTRAAFGFEDGGDPLVTVTLLDSQIDNNLTLSPGQYSLGIQKTGDNAISVTRN